MTATLQTFLGLPMRKRHLGNRPITSKRDQEVTQTFRLVQVVQAILVTQLRATAVRLARFPRRVICPRFPYRGNVGLAIPHPAPHRFQHIGSRPLRSRLAHLVFIYLHHWLRLSRFPSHRVQSESFHQDQRSGGHIMFCRRLVS